MGCREVEMEVLRLIIENLLQGYGKPNPTGSAFLRAKVLKAGIRSSIQSLNSNNHS